MDALQQLNLAVPIADTYADVENMLLCHIAEQLAANPDTLINATSEWRIKMLAQMGRLNKDSAKIIASKVGKVPSEVEAVVNTAINSVLLENGLTMTDKVSDSIAEALENYDRQAVKSKYNQVNTVMQYKAKQAYVNGVNSVADRFARIQQKALANSQEYLDVLNDNALAVTMGEKSRTEALRETINQMCDKGIPAFVDASGKEWSPEAYVNMDIRNTAKNSALAAQWGCMDELDQDVILVSSHSGARPLCAKFQGKFYSRKNKSGTIKDAKGKEYKFEPLSSTSFGEPAGLFGINCGHRMRGVSEGAFINREKQYDEKENSEEYEKVCEQRRQERKIRVDKTKRDALRAAGDDEGAKALNAKIAAENKALRAYCEQEGLTYRQDRTQIYGYTDTSRKKKAVDFVESVDISGENGIIKGKSNGNGSHSSEHSFEKIGKVDFNDKNAINTAMNDFEKMCKDSEIEHCRVITVSGDVYDVHGDSNTVDTTLLGDKMRGSINSHNHVTGRSQYSFSKEDIYSSVEDGSRISSAFDEKYKYSMEFNVAVTEDDVYNAYNEATTTVMNRKIFVGDVTDEDEQHEIVKETCRILGIKYERAER